jgi:hypothetical protein
MTDRTIIAVVSDLRKSGLTVEQQILVDELLMLSVSAHARAEAAIEMAELDAAKDDERRSANRERMRSVRERARTCMHTETQKENTPIPPKEKLYINNITPKPPLAAEPFFDAFWRVYPLKVGKGAARKAFRHACTRASADTIIDGVERYVQTKPDPKFTKHPSTWLNSDCWLDEPSNVVQYQRPAYLEPQKSYREQRDKQ